LKSLHRYALLLIVFMSSYAFCFAQSDSPPPPPPAPVIEYNAAAWKEYSSAEGGFSIKMPGTPQTTTMSTDVAPEKISFRTHALQTKTGYYAVMYNDLPVYSDEAATIKQGLEEFRNRMLRDEDMKLLREKEIIFNDKPALDLLLENSFTVIQARIFLVKERLFILMFATRPNVAFKSGHSSVKVEDQTDLYQTITTRFLDSFKVIPRETPSKARNIGHATGVGTGIGSGAGSGPVIVEATEGEVDSLLRQLKEKNQPVFGRCLDSNPCASVKAEGAERRLVEDELLGGKIISLPQPPYPPIARAARANGTVVVKVVLDESGKVIAAQSISGHPLLQWAAVKAAREARFEPTTLGGKPVKVTGNISYNFVLQ
jgi:TonB family protein